jgi:hypothetical protein
MKRIIAALVASAALLTLAAPAYAQSSTTTSPVTGESGARAGATTNTGSNSSSPNLRNGGPATGTAGAAAGHTYNGGNQSSKMKMGGPITNTAGAANGMTLNCKSGTRMVKGYKKSNGSMVKAYCRKTS